MDPANQEEIAWGVAAGPSGSFYAVGHEIIPGQNGNWLIQEYKDLPVPAATAQESVPAGTAGSEATAGGSGAPHAK